jgi:hypothetical protein
VPQSAADWGDFMRGQTIAQACVAVVFSLVLAACGGGGPSISLLPGSSSSSSSSGGASSSGSSSSSSSGGGVGTQIPTHIILVPSATALSGSSSSSISLVATVTDANNVEITGTSVKFSASSGVLVVTNGSGGAVNTGTDGTASATLTNGGVSTPRTITVTAVAATLSATTTIQVTPAPVLALGTLSSTGTFTAGAISVGQNSLAAGASSGLQVNIYDTANNISYSGAATVTFTSPCTSQNLSSIVSPVASSNGTFNSTYTATGCSGSDTITAVAVINGASLPAATAKVTVQAASLGSIQFDSTKTATSPACASNTTPISCTIGLKGTGQNETAQIYFKVLDSNGNPVQGQTVNFALTTTVGGLSLGSTGNTVKSDASGEVSTTVTSGTVHTAVRVTASIPSTNLSSQSSLLTVSTGFPAQNGSSIASTVLNLVGNNVDGNTAQITVHMSDRYNNPVPDNTPVSFQAECGQIGSSCSTTNGACSVTFTTAGARTAQLVAQNPLLAKENSCSANPHGLGCDDHRCTVLATAIGEESFNDCNGTGQYVSKDNSSNNPTQCKNGDFFVSLPEAWLDSNENGVFDGDFETPADYNHNGQYDLASGKFIGLLCNDPDCDTTQTLLNVRQQIVLILTSSDAAASVTDTSNNVIGTTASPIVVPVNGTVTVIIVAEDSAGQVPPAATTINASLTTGSVGAPNPFIVPSTNDFGPLRYELLLKGPATAGSDTLVLTTTTPGVGTAGGITTVTNFIVTYK